MKKFLNLFIQIILISNLIFFVPACYNPLLISDSDDNSETKVPPIIKDIKYYQSLIEQTKTYVNDCKEWIETVKKDWQNDKNNNISDEDYQLLIDQISAELYTYQAEINEYQYQILLLKKEDIEFTFEQILEGINITTEKITNLEQVLELKAKYPHDYRESELKNIKNNIKQTIKIKKMFLTLKEKGEK